MDFTAIAINRKDLKSKIVRDLIGERVIDLAEQTSQTKGGFIVQIFNFGKKLAGFVVGALFNFIQWSFTSIWDFLVEAYFEIKYFDWNQTDAEIKNQLEANDSLIAGALGSLAGTGLVWLTGISVATGLSFKFPVLAGNVALALAEEGGVEIRGKLINLLTVSRQPTFLTQKAIALC